MAGIYPVTLIKEPEAAAMYTLHVLQDRGLEVWPFLDPLFLIVTHLLARLAMLLLYVMLEAGLLI